MKAQDTLKELYGMEYYRGDFQSSLTQWYNRLIDKTIDEIDIFDISRMIRQNVLEDLAIDKAIELFLIEPFAGEMQDGDLLKMLVSYSGNILKSNKVQDLIELITKLENNLEEFDWASESSRITFGKNLAYFKNILF